MRYFFAFALTLLLAQPVLAATDQRGVTVVEKNRDGRKRIALVIGNSSYSSSPLKNPANDARAIADTLRKLGFEVDEKLNLGYIPFQEALESFGSKLRSGGVGLFYYAGHGMQVNGSNYLIPVDAKINAENEVRYKAVDAGLVLAKMEQAMSDINIAIFDACRDNPFVRSSRSGSRGLAQVDAPTGTLIAYATAPGRTASDGDGNNGVYTESLIETLQTPGLKVEEVFKRVRKLVLDKTDKGQVPWESSSLVGDFQFLQPNNMTDLDLSPLHSSPVEPIVTAKPKTKQEAGLQGKYTDPTTGMEFLPAPGNCFQMGDTFGIGDTDELPVHTVCVDDFSIGKYNVTKDQFKKFVDETGYQTEAEKGNGCYVHNSNKWAKDSNTSWRSPGFYQEDNEPAVCISWNDANAFSSWLSQKSNMRYRLPSEAEWEYAARSGGKNEKYAGSGSAEAVAWYKANSGYRTHPAGRKQPNGLGLYDMSGNVWQWVSDWFGENYYAASPKNNPQGPASSQHRVGRGGSWFSEEQAVRATKRMKVNPVNRYVDSGFRLVFTAQ